MALYELGVIIDPEATPEDETALLERMETIIVDGGGEMVDKDAWGRRELAYPIRKKNYGVYHFWKFEVGGEVLPDLGFELRTNDLVMRSLVLNLDRELRRFRRRERQNAIRAAAKAAAAEAEAVADAADAES